MDQIAVQSLSQNTCVYSNSLSCGGEPDKRRSTKLAIPENLSRDCELRYVLQLWPVSISYHHQFNLCTLGFKAKANNIRVLSIFKSYP